MSDSQAQSYAALSEQLLAALRGKTFGGIFFWRFALVRPHDQAFAASTTRVEGDRLDLEFLHAGGQGSPATLSIWSPGGLEVAATGLSLRQAARLRLSENEAWPDGGEYRIRTPRGEGSFARGDSPALTLQF